jgi:hypothetical protein
MGVSINLPKWLREIVCKCTFSLISLSEIVEILYSHPRVITVHTRLDIFVLFSLVCTKKFR